MPLIDYLPDEVKRSEYVRDIEAMLEELVKLAKDEYDASLSNMFVTTADQDAIKEYELDYGVMSTGAGNLEERRSVILAKMRGQGTCTQEMVKNMAMAFSGGEVEISEHPESSSIDVKFVGTLGIPPNMEDFKQAIEKVIPAHITYVLVYTYATWGMAENYTWEGLNNYTWEQFRNGDFKK